MGVARGRPRATRLHHPAAQQSQNLEPARTERSLLRDQHAVI